MEREALKLALEALETVIYGNDGTYKTLSQQCEAAITAIKAALEQPEHEYDWKDLYEKEKRRSAMWLAKYEEVAGPAPKAYPVAQPAQEPVSFPCCGYTDANAIRWNQFNGVVQCHMCGQVYTVAQPAQEPAAWVERIGGGVSYDLYHEAARKLPEGVKFDLYTAPPQREWVGLTNADIERIKLMTYEKETNADGEEQEAVNIDWLIKTTEHFCKEKNS